MHLQGIGFVVPQSAQEDRHGLMQMLAASGGPARHTNIFNAKFEMRAQRDSVELSQFMTALTKAGLLERPTERRRR